MNIREIVGLSPNYSKISREERNYAAILFAALCFPDNARSFLTKCGFNKDINSDFGIYFEYAYLRDLWSKIKDEEIKKRIIKSKLKINNINNILNLSLREINKKFGVGGEPSSDFLQYPGKWSITKYNNNFPDNDDFIKICKFKWSFNIKPDIVIHLDKDHAICIEAKYESGEGFYPGTDVEKKIFKERGISYVGQIELQKYMMQELLGIETDFIFLVFHKETSTAHQVISWAEAFSSVKIDQMPKFTKDMINNISKRA